MVGGRALHGVACVLVLSLLGMRAAAQAPGTMRGTRLRPRLRRAGRGRPGRSSPRPDRRSTTGDQGNFAISAVRPGRYTVVVLEGRLSSARSRRTSLVQSGQLTDLDILARGRVHRHGGARRRGPGRDAREDRGRHREGAAADCGSKLRRCSIRSARSMISRSGASDAAAAVRLVAGVSLSDGKSAVVRGLPDRYVSLAAERRAAADGRRRQARGRARPVSRRRHPEHPGQQDVHSRPAGRRVGRRRRRAAQGHPGRAVVLQGRRPRRASTRRSAGSDFLSYKGGGVDCWGRRRRRPRPAARQPRHELERRGGRHRRTTPPNDYKWSMAAGGSHEFDSGVTIGGAISFFYERDSSFFDNGINDSYWVTSPGAPMTPQYDQGTPPAGRVQDEPVRRDAGGAAGAVGRRSPRSACRPSTTRST